MRYSKILNWLFLAVFVEPPIFSIITAYGRIHLIYMYLKSLLIIYTVVKLLLNRDSQIHRMFSLVTSVWIIQILSTVLYQGNLQMITISYLAVATVSIWFYKQFSINYHNTIENIADYLGLLTALNFLTMIIFPNGFVEAENWRGDIAYWILGSENNLPGIILPSIVSCWIAYLITNKKHFLLFEIIGTISIILSTSATGLIGLVVFLSLTMFQYYENVNGRYVLQFLTLNKCIVFVLISAVFIIAGQNISFLSYIVEDVLGKDLTFTGRADIWMRFLNVIVESPVIGFGLFDTELMRDTFNTSHQHDYYLHLLFQGGSLTLLFFLNFLRICANKIKKSNNIMLKTTLTYGIFSFLFMCLTEVYGDFIFIIPFYLLIMAGFAVQYQNINPKYEQM